MMKLPSLLFIVFSLLLISVMTVSAATVYVYQAANGTRIISNRINHSAKLKLIKKYGPKSSIKSLKPLSYGSSKRRTPSPQASAFDSVIYEISDRYQLDRALVKAVIQIESAFNPTAVSNKGAQGLMQLMPLTAKNYDVTDPFNANENIRGGTQYLKHLMQTYNNNISLALAAYNAGETAVNKYKGIPPYPETQRYVKLVLELHRSYQNNPEVIYG